MQKCAPLRRRVHAAQQPSQRRAAAADEHAPAAARARPRSLRGRPPRPPHLRQRALAAGALLSPYMCLSPQVIQCVLPMLGAVLWSV